MNAKKRPNKLDRYAEQLDGWLGVEKITLDQALDRLRELGCDSARSSLSAWWSRRYQEQIDAQVLGMIITGKSQCDLVKKAFSENPAPGMEVIENLHRVLTMQLATKGAVDPDMLEMADRFTRTLIEFAKLRGSDRDRDLAEQKYRDLVTERKAAIQKELDAAKSTGGITSETREKIERELKLL